MIIVQELRFVFMVWSNVFFFCLFTVGCRRGVISDVAMLVWFYMVGGKRDSQRAWPIRRISMLVDGEKRRC